MNLRMFLILCAAIAATEASALSCLRPDAVMLYEQARDSEDAFHIVRGELQITGPVNEPNPDTGAVGETQARLIGTMLTDEGFGAVFDQPVTIVSSCAGPWCGSATGQEGLLIAAVRIGEDRFTLDAGPCGGDMLPYDGDGVGRLLSCHRFGRCELNDQF